MPPKIDLSGYTVEQAQKRLIGLCDAFINDLEEKLIGVTATDCIL